jgi:membrane protease YdiL (CAAX protease family)
MQKSTGSFPFWYILIFVPMVTSQVVRLYQTTALGWLICDYAGRLGALAILALIPMARATAYRQQPPLRTSWLETVLWSITLVIVYPFFSAWVAPTINAWIPHTRLGHSPSLHGWLNIFDLTAGLALVAYHEEIVFRRCAQAVLNFRGCKDITMIFLSSLLFTAYHWTTGIGNMVAVFFFGIYVMLFLRRTGALWPIVLTHFLVDVVNFSGIINFL